MRPRPGRLASCTVGSAHTSWPSHCSAGTVASRPTCPRTTCEEMARTFAMHDLISRCARAAVGPRRCARSRAASGRWSGRRRARSARRPRGRRPRPAARRGRRSRWRSRGCRARGARPMTALWSSVLVVVVAGPGVDHLEALERRHALRRAAAIPRCRRRHGRCESRSTAGGSSLSSGDLPHRKNRPSGRNHTPDGSTVSGARCSASDASRQSMT